MSAFAMDLRGRGTVVQGKRRREESDEEAPPGSAGDWSDGASSDSEDAAAPEESGSDSGAAPDGARAARRQRRAPASAALLRLPDELVARVIDHLGGGFGVMRASVMRALVDCSAAAPALAEHVELLAARAWTARTGAADARDAQRRRRRACWLRALRLRSGVGGALSCVEPRAGAPPRWELPRVEPRAGQLGAARCSLVLGPRQPPPARCADGERFALEARLLRVGTGWTSVGVVVLHGGVPEADFEPDRRIATRVYDAPALCGVAWNANTGDLLHLEPGAPPSGRGAYWNAGDDYAAQMTSPRRIGRARPREALAGQQLDAERPRVVTIEVSPRAGSLRARCDDGEWTARLPLGALLSRGWAFAATLYAGASAEFTLRRLPPSDDGGESSEGAGEVGPAPRVLDE